MDKPIRKAVRCYLIENDKVVATKYKEGNQKVGYYDIPGGKIEKGETSKEAAIREMKEETGLTITNLKYKGNMIIEYPNRTFDFDVFITNKYMGKTQEFKENTSEWININELLQKDKKLSCIMILKQSYIKGLLDNRYNFNMYIKVDEQENILDIIYQLKNIEDVFKPSESENHGIDLITEKDINILSIGISTAGAAEIEMTKKNPNNHIIATTIDEEGLEFTKNIIKQYGLEDRIELKMEDVSTKLPYSDEQFDFIYARLVLHYLDNDKLKQTLKEIKRILKNNGSFYIVVRSRNEWEAKLKGTTYDEVTGLTRYPKYKTIRNR